MSKKLSKKRFTQPWLYCFSAPLFFWMLVPFPVGCSGDHDGIMSVELFSLVLALAAQPVFFLSLLLLRL